jgi:hypothetical protein
MADLLDIAPSTAIAVVDIDGEPITVRSVSANGIASILTRFPALLSLIKEGWGDDLIPRLILGCAASVGPIIAAGCGHLADEVYEQHAANLSVHLQAKLLKAIFRVSFPNGLSSFAGELADLMNIIMGGGAKPIKMRSRISRSGSPPSSDVASRQIMQ